MDILANKYRPKNFSDIIGQDVVCKSLFYALANNKLHHAYIFEGKYGCGKTTAARVLAATENCLSKQMSGDACGSCANCLSIMTGKSVDVKELDAASNRSIDDIRAIQEDINHAGITCKTRYVIIDEAHDLTGYAADAALKMIEEPPPNVRFIFCTTDAFKLKDTIISRCISYRFKPLNFSDISSNIKKISHIENISVEEDAIRLIAESGEGSMRYAMQNLEKVIVGSAGQNITVDIVGSILGISASNNLYFYFVHYIVNKDIPKAYALLNKIFLDGISVDKLLQGFIKHLSNLQKIKLCPENIQIMNMSERDKKYYEHQVSVVPIELIHTMIHKIGSAYRDLEYNIDPQVVFETFIMESMCVNAKS